MKLSVITPTLNSIRFIERCVENAMTQGDVVVEHIIADGGSTDGTVERVLALQQIHPHIRFLPGPDRGQSDALNKATGIATGDVIGILNADDFYEPGAANEAMRHLARVRAPGFVCGDCKVIDADDVLKFWNRPTDLRLDALLLGWKYAQFPCNPSAYFYHREVHAIVGGYDVSDHHAMDLEFILGAARHVDMTYVPSHWGNFRFMQGGKTHDDDRGRERTHAIINRHLAALPLWRRIRIRLSQARIDVMRRRAASSDRKRAD